MSPATARAILLHLVVGYLGLLSAALALHGARGAAARRIARGPSRSSFHEGRAALAHGVARAAAGAAGLAAAAWALS
jgi:hypothetical protein